MAEKILTYLSLGSNLGDRKQNLKNAEMRLQEQAGSVIKVSRIYESDPSGFSSDNLFYNGCLILETSLAASALMKLILEIEKDMGRSRSTSGYGDRLIDIDLLLYGPHVISDADLIIPHPRMTERSFVLVPLAEIAPDVLHPLARCTIKELLSQIKEADRLSPV